MSDQTVITSVRIPAGLRKRIEQAAKDEERSINSVIVRALRKALTGKTHG